VKTRLHLIEQFNEEIEPPSELGWADDIGSREWYQARCDVLSAVKMKLLAKNVALTAERDALRERLG